MSTPTPTDPREEKPVEVTTPPPFCDKLYCVDCGTQVGNFFAVEDVILCGVCLENKSTNSKLAAEIAELRMEIVAVLDQLPSAIRVHEGSAAENICASLAVSVAALRAELEAARKERDEAKAQFQKARELKEKYFWELGQIEVSIDGEGKIEGTGWSVAHKKVLELISIRDEANAFTKHVGGPTFKDSVDVILRTKSQDEDKIAEMFDIIKRTGAEIGTALAAKDAAEKKVAILAELNADLRARLNRVIGPVEKYCGIIIPVASATILTEGGGQPCAHKEIASQNSSTPTSPDKSGNESKTTCASNSPDVGPIPTQGELKPFDLTEALAGAKVVTRDGRMVTFIRKWSDECCVKGKIDNQDYTWTTDGRWYVGETDSQHDLFMSPQNGQTALTPAPTQEPPAGGVTISTEKKGGDEPCAPQQEMDIVPANVSISTRQDIAYPAGASNSPADVPPEGRGECSKPEWNDEYDTYRTVDVPKHDWVISYTGKSRVCSRCLAFERIMLPTEGSGA